MNRGVRYRMNRVLDEFGTTKAKQQVIVDTWYRKVNIEVTLDENNLFV